MKLKDIKPNPNNPRVIRNDRFTKLKQSIQEFPKMMALRPIVLDSDNIILGGNMRYRALQDLNYREILDSWVCYANDLTEDEKRRFIIADNVSFGTNDWDELANTWDNIELIDWGLEVWDGEEIIEGDQQPIDKEVLKTRITLEYTEEEYETISKKFNEMKGSKEQIVWKLMGL